MGLAVSAMHYTGMAAVHFLPLGGEAAASPADGMDAVHLAILVVVAILGIIVLAVLALRWVPFSPELLMATIWRAAWVARSCY